jgi:hypothetical protein
MPDHDYEAGLRDGKLEAIEKMVTRHGERLDDHENRFRYLEKIVYGITGAIALVQFGPQIAKWIGP